MQAWRASTKKQYSTYFLKWFEFCKKSKLEPNNAKLHHVLIFLQILRDNHYSYSAINTAKSAIVLILDLDTSDKEIIRKFMKGTFNMKPPKPKYKQIWDVSIVLDYIETLGNNEDISLKMLTYKCTMLIALTSGQRVQTLAALRISDMSISFKGVQFIIQKFLKTTSPFNNKSSINLPFFEENHSLCVVKCLHTYLNRTEPLRQSDSLLISFISPHKPVSSETISRWLKEMLKAAGVDTAVYSAHSTRAAATSTAAKRMDICSILECVGWKSKSTFAKFYNKPITDEPAERFAHAVMRGKTDLKSKVDG